ncbi:MAG: DUF2953 domain-containing protein [Oscillospiraceae bacterium]
MAALYILGGFLLLLILLLLLRVGVEVRLGEPLTVTLRLGPVRRQLLPQKKKEKKAQPEEKPKEQPKKAKKDKPAGTKPKIGPAEIRRGAELLLPALQKALRRTRRSIRVHPLNVHVVFGGDDPAAVAEQYGWATAAMWSLMPQAERLLVIPEPHIRLDTDFQAERTRTEGELGLSIRIGSTLGIALALLPAALRWYRELPRAAAKEKETTAADTAAAAKGQADGPGDKPTEAADGPHADKKGE